MKRRMKVEYRYRVCAGWFQCVQDWDAFEMNMMDGKAELAGSEEVEEDVYVREVPADSEEDAIAAAESCPVDAIIVYDDEGEQLVP